MALEFCSFASGSSGNSYLVRSDKTAVIVDAGISCKRIEEGLAACGNRIEEISAVLITHEHSDHVKSLRTVARKAELADVYATRGTWGSVDWAVREEKRRVVTSGESFFVGDIEVVPMRLSHDANEPVGYSLLHGGQQVSILTDTGVVDERIFENIYDSDLIAIESNFDEQMLQYGSYPWYLKQRIRGDQGHLSNDVAAKTVARLLSENNKPRRILLAHLSKENNFPEMAYETVRNHLADCGHFLADCLKLDILRRDAVSRLYRL